MKEVVIKERFSMSERGSQLCFDDGLPVVVAYVLTDAPRAHGARARQTAAIRQKLKWTFGPEGCNIVWVIETGGAGVPFFGWKTRECREGLHFATEVVRCGYADVLSVSSIDRIADNLRDWLSISYYVFALYDIRLVLAEDPDPELWGYLDPGRTSIPKNLCEWRHVPKIGAIRRSKTARKTRDPRSVVDSVNDKSCRLVRLNNSTNVRYNRKER